MNVLTTSEVPMQIRKINEPTLKMLLPWISNNLIGTELPPELVEVIWEYLSEGTMPRAEVEKHRLSLMDDRKVSGGRRAFGVRLFFVFMLGIDLFDQFRTIIHYVNIKPRICIRSLVSIDRTSRRLRQLCFI